MPLLEALRPAHRRAALGIGFRFLGGLHAGAPAPLTGVTALRCALNCPTLR